MNWIPRPLKPGEIAFLLVFGILALVAMAFLIAPVLKSWMVI